MSEKEKNIAEQKPSSDSKNPEEKVDQKQNQSDSTIEKAVVEEVETTSSPESENSKKEDSTIKDPMSTQKEKTTDSTSAKEQSSQTSIEKESTSQEEDTSANKDQKAIPSETEKQVESDKPTNGQTSTENKRSNSEEKDNQNAKSAQEEIDDNVAEDSEDEERSKRHEVEMKDYHAMEMPELVKELERLIKNEKIQVIRDHVVGIKTEFDAKYEEEVEQKREDFIEDGGNIIDFYYSTPLKQAFNSAYFDYKEKRNNYYKALKQNLNENLNNRLAIIEELKGMIGEGADMQANYKRFKELQNRWKKAGAVPRDQYKTVWNNYHHHVENFYDFLHLDREFRDMDFKHNLEQKLKIITRAEELGQEENINRAFRELQMLHKMWKEDLGPVAKEYRDDLWEKFSEATKMIHENRQAYFEELDKLKEKNLEIKEKIIASIAKLGEGELKSHRQAQQGIKELEKLRQQFFKAGQVPRSKNESTWQNFKQSVRSFNRQKNAFYKNLKKEQHENLTKKKELIQTAEEHKDSEDFKTVTPLMKKIQAEWKKIGHVPRKDSDKVWKKFKAACNHYFDRLHALREEENKEGLEAFDRKKDLLEETKALSLSGNREEDLTKIKERISAWKEIGAVPQNKRYIEGKFNKALDHLFSQLDIDKKQVELLKYEKRVQALDEADDDRKIEKEQFFLRKKVEETKAEIRQLENNLQFFSTVDESNPLVKKVLDNIKRLKEQHDTWKAKLSQIRSL